MLAILLSSLFFFFNDTATTEIYTLSLHDALPIYYFVTVHLDFRRARVVERTQPRRKVESQCGNIVIDRKSTRLNSSHLVISYAVFCLKKKKKRRGNFTTTHA